AYEIAEDGYHFCIYVPFGEDWFGYFMRRLAERPQNLNLAVKEFVKPKTLAVGAGAIAAIIGLSFGLKGLKKRK
ncbi:hypothetical protein NL504_27180, partial [Klebsiella pneumoniae]|nr:hypothetical protein [Klebsiella pneumoniae]